MPITILSENAQLTPIEVNEYHKTEVVDLRDYGVGCRTQFEQMEEEAYSEEYLKWAAKQGYTPEQLSQMLNEDLDFPDDGDDDFTVDDMEHEMLFQLAEVLIEKISTHFQQDGVPAEFYQEYEDLHSFIYSQYADDEDDEELETPTDYTQD
jgi:hypothetical protein